MPYKKISGIYQIKNVINNKVYVGSSINLKNRLNTHKYTLKHNNHFNNHLQSSYNKHGVENFIFEIIEECDKEVLLERENYWIKNFRATDKNFGYNKRPDATNNSGIIISEITREKLRSSHLGHKRSEEAHNKILSSQYKNVYQYSFNGDFINGFQSIIEAEKKTNILKTGISACCRGINKQAGGYIWSFFKKNKIDPLKSNKNIRYKHFKKITSIDESNNKCLEFEKVKDAALYYNISSSLIYQILSKKIESTNTKYGKINFIYE